MSFLFKPKQKTPQELAKSTKDAIIKLQESLGNNSLASVLAPLPSSAVGSGSGPIASVSSAAGAAAATLPASPIVNIDRKSLEKV